MTVAPEVQAAMSDAIAAVTICHNQDFDTPIRIIRSADDVEVFAMALVILASSLVCVLESVTESTTIWPKYADDVLAQVETMTKENP